MSMSGGVPPGEVPGESEMHILTVVYLEYDGKYYANFGRSSFVAPIPPGKLKRMGKTTMLNVNYLQQISVDTLDFEFWKDYMRHLSGIAMKAIESMPSKVDIASNILKNLHKSLETYLEETQLHIRLNRRFLRLLYIHRRDKFDVLVKLALTIATFVVNIANRILDKTGKSGKCDKDCEEFKGKIKELIMSIQGTISSDYENATVDRFVRLFNDLLQSYTWQIYIIKMIKYVAYVYALRRVTASDIWEAYIQSQLIRTGLDALSWLFVRIWFGDDRDSVTWLYSVDVLLAFIVQLCVTLVWVKVIYKTYWNANGGNNQRDLLKVYPLGMIYLTAAVDCCPFFLIG